MQPEEAHRADSQMKPDDWQAAKAELAGLGAARATAGCTQNKQVFGSERRDRVWQDNASAAVCARRRHAQ